MKKEKCVEGLETCSNSPNPDIYVVVICFFLRCVSDLLRYSYYGHYGMRNRQGMNKIRWTNYCHMCDCACRAVHRTRRKEKHCLHHDVHGVGLFLNHCSSTLACLLNSIFDTLLDT